MKSYAFSWYRWSYKFFPQSIFSSGNILSRFLLKRKIYQILHDVISICYLYHYFKTNQENKTFINKIILDLEENKKVINKIRLIKIEKLQSLSEFILKFFTIPTLITIITAGLTIGKNTSIELGFLSQISDFILIYIIIIIIEIILLWIIPQISWYQEILKITNFKDKEISIYDTLILLQRFILIKGFPQITKILDEE